MKNKIEFYKHNLNNSDYKEVKKILQSLFLTTGDEVKKFENKLAEYLNCKYCIGLTSCTDAIFLSLKGLGIRKGDEVITTPMTFISSANAIEYCGAKPIFVDIEKNTGNIDANLIEKKINKKTKAILVVHLYGQMCDMKKISKIAKKYNLKLIEDSAHCLEGERDGVRPGQLSDAACFSFYATKNITSGEGGAIATKNKKLYDWLMKARLHGMTKGAAERYSKIYKHWDMEFLGYKANMSNIQAALLINQIDRVDKLLILKEKIAKKYNDGFKENKIISIPNILPNTTHARHLYTVLVNPNQRDKIIYKLQENRIGVGVNFRAIHLLTYYKDKYGYKLGDFPIAENFGSSTISLPFYPKLSQPQIKYVIKTLNKITNPKA